MVLNQLFAGVQQSIFSKWSLFNSFHTTALFPNPLKTSENQGFTDFFREYRKRPVVLNGLIPFAVIFPFISSLILHLLAAEY